MIGIPNQHWPLSEKHVAVASDLKVLDTGHSQLSIPVPLKPALAETGLKIGPSSNGLFNLLLPLMLITQVAIAQIVEKGLGIEYDWYCQGSAHSIFRVGFS